MTLGPRLLPSSICSQLLFFLGAVVPIMLSVTPYLLDFGCVAQGFIYSIDAMVTNNDTRIQRLKVICTLTKGPSINLISPTMSNQPVAPGMSALIKIELRAEAPSTLSEYEITVIAEHNNLKVRSNIKSIVIPMDIFKYLAKSLRLQKRPGRKQFWEYLVETMS